MSTTMNDLIGLGDTGLAAVESTNTGAGMAGAGASFGELIKGVGNAVAATQLQLTENSADTTSKLAETLVDVIAVQETIIDNAGNITASKSHMQKLPLLNFIDPVFYQYPQVKVEGHFVIDSFAVDTSSSAKVSGSSFGGGFSFSQKPTLFGTKSSASGSAGFASGSSSTDLATSSKQATAVGRMRLYSQLAPQPGLGVPKPVQVVIGPSLAILEGPTHEDVDDAGNATRTMSLLIQLRDKDGQPIKKKPLSIDADGAMWDYATPDDATKIITGDTGQDAGNLSIVLTRTFPVSADPAAPPPDKSAKPVTVNVRLGLVAAGVTISL